MESVGLRLSRVRTGLRGDCNCFLFQRQKLELGARSLQATKRHQDIRNMS